MFTVYSSFRQTDVILTFYSWEKNTSIQNKPHKMRGKIGLSVRTITKLSQNTQNLGKMSNCISLCLYFKHRTSDQIYTLHTINDKHVHQNKTNIFACFIDFEKHSIKRTLLKLLETGIGGKTFDLIRTKNNTCAVKKGNKLISFLGVRKGCPLSPTRFSIYLNELAKELNNSTAPGTNLTESEINVSSLQMI